MTEVFDETNRPEVKITVEPRRARMRGKSNQGEDAGTEVGASVPAVVEGDPSLATMMARLMELSTNPAIDVEKTRALHQIYKDVVADQAKKEYAEAMNKAQEEIQPVTKTVWNDHTKSFFAKLEHVDAAVRPIYVKYGFSVSYPEVPPINPGNIRIECCVTRGGHTERFGREAPPDTVGAKGGGTKTALQGAGSTDTYLRRYALCAAFNIPLEGLDNDGNGPICSDKQIEHLRGLIAAAANIDPTINEARLALYVNKTETFDNLPLVRHATALSTITDTLNKLTKRKVVTETAGV